MNKEFKKGVIEICVLSYIKKEDRYGYQIVSELEGMLDVKESTIYPILKRLHRDMLVNTYLKESNTGPARKYYKITAEGESKLSASIEQWKTFVNKISDYLYD